MKKLKILFITICCAIKVLGNNWNAAKGTLDMIIKKALTVGGFANAFGVTYAMNWLSCMYQVIL